MTHFDLHFHDRQLNVCGVMSSTAFYTGRPKWQVYWLKPAIIECTLELQT